MSGSAPSLRRFAYVDYTLDGRMSQRLMWPYRTPISADALGRQIVEHLRAMWPGWRVDIVRVTV